MRPATWPRVLWSLWAFLVWTIPGALAEPPSSLEPTPPSAAAAAEAEAQDESPEAALKRAMDLERQRDWSAAIDAYEEALKRWPGEADFRHRLRLCEIHYRLGRRYQDPSFRNVLLHLSRTKALELYSELLERIESHYVEPVEREPLLRRGLDNLEVALRDPVFLTVQAPNADPARVRWLRDAYLRQRARVVARDRREALAQVSSACELARQSLDLSPAAVVLEFVFGACDALDDYSNYLTPDKLDDLYAMIDGNFVGLGVELKTDPMGLRLVGVIGGGPAADAGLKAGDRITHIGGQSVAGLGLDEAANRLQGTEGTSVEIGVLRPDGSSQTFRLIRRPVEVHSVEHVGIVEPTLGVGYLQLTGFQKTSTEELAQAIEALRRQGLRYLIIDLRGNPGGLLNVAVEIADRFLDQGVIVSTKGRAAGQSYIYRADPDVSWRMPVALLIDHDSASASEILAGALKENRRALVVGERSYGKGSVQSIFSLRTVPTGLKLTTAKFYSPRNRPYSEQGVEPDLAVRIAARPKHADDFPSPSADFGNPDRDPVLSQALLQARRQLAQAPTR